MLKGNSLELMVYQIRLNGYDFPPWMARHSTMTNNDQNPTERLEALRLTSLSLNPEQLVLPAKNVPRRDMPRSSIDLGQHPNLTPNAPRGSGGSGHVSPVVARSPGADGHVHFADEAVAEEEEAEHESTSAGTQPAVQFGAVKFAPSPEGRAAAAGGKAKRVPSPTDALDD